MNPIEPWSDRRAGVFEDAFCGVRPSSHKAAKRRSVEHLRGGVVLCAFRPNQRVPTERVASV